MAEAGRGRRRHQARARAVAASSGARYRSSVRHLLLRNACGGVRLKSDTSCSTSTSSPTTIHARRASSWKLKPNGAPSGRREGIAATISIRCSYGTSTRFLGRRSTGSGSPGGVANPAKARRVASAKRSTPRRWRSQEPRPACQSSAARRSPEADASPRASARPSARPSVEYIAGVGDGEPATPHSAGGSERSTPATIDCSRRSGVAPAARSASPVRPSWRDNASSRCSSPTQW